MHNLNNFKNKFLCVTSLIGIIIAAWCCQLVAKPTPVNKIINDFSAHITPQLSTKHYVNHKLLSIKAPNLDQKVLKLALKAYYNAKEAGHGNNDTLSIVDYSLPSTERRLWVIDMRSNKVVYHTHVSHGIGTGDNYARNFSNRHGSHMSSLGLFLTGGIYQGKYGKSLELHGIDGKFNSNAYARRIVVHAAHYADESVIQKLGRLGRSFGCLSLSKRVAYNVMDKIKGGSYVFCYYPDQEWLRGSKLLS